MSIAFQTITVTACKMNFLSVPSVQQTNTPTAMISVTFSDVVLTYLVPPKGALISTGAYDYEKFLIAFTRLTMRNNSFPSLTALDL